MNITVICSTEDTTTLISSINEAWGNYVSTHNKLNPATSKEDVTIIRSKESLDTHNFAKKKPDFVFIETDLRWGVNKTASGYEVALELILHKLKDYYFQIQFISPDSRKDLLTEVDGKFKKLVQTFQHLNFSNLKNEINFNENLFSPLHFELIKSLVLDDSNRINVIEHDIDTIKNNLKIPERSNDLSPYKDKLLRQIEELSILKIISRDKIDLLRKSIDKTKNSEMLKKDISTLERIIKEAKGLLTNSHSEEFSSLNKANYKVVVIEDEIEWRTFFSNTFLEMYQTVFPGNKEDIAMFDMSQAKEVIKARKNYNIFILDLLYKDNDGFWLPFNGLDLYKYVKEINPYSCIRIITSLPRDIVSKISGLLLKTDIKISHVFTKKVGYERLKFGIYDRALELNIECEENERKKTVFKPIPKLGIFDWNGVNLLLYRLMTEERGVYENFWHEAFKFLQLFDSGNLGKNTGDWKNGELPTPKKKGSVTDSYILARLPVILTHRLLVIKKAFENDQLIIDAEIFENSILKRISKISTFDKGYIQTKLGFNTTPYENSEQGIYGFKIGLKNLFPEEILFISDIQKGKVHDEKLTNHLSLLNWFNSILCDLEIYENWTELNLDFDPYVSKEEIDNSGQINSSHIVKSLQLSHLEMYLRSLIKYSHSILVQKMIEQSIKHYSIKNEEAIPRHIFTLIDQFFSTENLI